MAIEYSEGFEGEIREKLAHVQAERARLNVVEQALLVLLKESRNSRGHVVEATGSAHGVSGAAGVGAATLSRTGLRGLLRKIVEDNPGILAPQVADRVRASGFDMGDTKTPLAHRVGVELRRMAKIGGGGIRKRGQQYFPAPTGGGVHENG